MTPSTHALSQDRTLSDRQRRLFSALHKENKDLRVALNQLQHSSSQTQACVTHLTQLVTRLLNERRNQILDESHSDQDPENDPQP